MFNARHILKLRQFSSLNSSINKCITKQLLVTSVRCLNTPNDAFQKQGSYEGPGKTTVAILNDDYSGVCNLIDSFSVDGFRLNDNTKILGPCIVFPTQVLSKLFICNKTKINFYQISF